jgi:glycopeptidolipid biosynthesis protein
MDREDGLLPLSRGQLDIWLSHESGLAGTEWQLGLLGRIDGTVQPGLLLEAIRQAMREAEPARAAFFEIDGQVFQKPIDYSDIELPFYDYRNSDDPVRTMFRTRVDEYYWFGLCHHISVSGDPVPPAYFGSLQDAVDCAIPQLFAAQVERIPGAAALTCGGRPGRWPD